MNLNTFAKSFGFSEYKRLEKISTKVFKDGEMLDDSVTTISTSPLTATSTKELREFLDDLLYGVVTSDSNDVFDAEVRVADTAINFFVYRNHSMYKTKLITW